MKYDRCSECEHRLRNPERETQWGFPCTKILERIDKFYDDNKTMNTLDKYRFSPHLHVKPEQRACGFFQSRVVNV